MRGTGEWGKRTEPWRAAGTTGWGGTFTRSRAAVVFKVGAVLAFVVLRALAEIVTGAVVALGAILAGVGLTIIYVQLQGGGAGVGGEETKV